MKKQVKSDRKLFNALYWIYHWSTGPSAYLVELVPKFPWRQLLWTRYTIFRSIYSIWTDYGIRSPTDSSSYCRLPGPWSLRCPPHRSALPTPAVGRGWPSWCPASVAPHPACCPPGCPPWGHCRCPVDRYSAPCDTSIRRPLRRHFGWGIRHSVRLAPVREECA